ncbi:SIS domain-containing protein [Pseudonocardia bannensis]|uniref:SIS domain-containing protein n=1 Tax=Pseudonocardia bannensis TaxID=630973 RepID=A0A848DJK1_9PSEU|nr:SIS domain-containing protein [Pseudonocardia bannensis]NMH92745.1 SIS domain-containing protein [Pseudonocardia bannensis]
MTVELTEVTAGDVSTAFARRRAPIAALGTDADALAAACHAMARRFHRGGRLLALGTGPAAADAAHVVVEFVHPVIVGKRALPALALPGGGSAATVEVFGGPDDIALVFSSDGAEPALADAMAAAVRSGLLTVALLGGGADGRGGAVGAVPGLDHVIVVPSEDPRVVREARVTSYHVLWELVHVFLDAPEVLA